MDQKLDRCKGKTDRGVSGLSAKPIRDRRSQSFMTPPTGGGFYFKLSPHAPFGAPRIMKNRVQGAEGSRIQVKGVEVKTLESWNPGILEPYFRIKNG